MINAMLPTVPSAEKLQQTLVRERSRYSVIVEDNDRRSALFETGSAMFVASVPVGRLSSSCLLSQLPISIMGSGLDIGRRGTDDHLPIFNWSLTPSPSACQGDG